MQAVSALAKYGAQQDSDIWRPDCGNGVRPDGVTPVTGNDPTDTSLAITPAFVQGWISHLISLYGNAAAGGVMFYNLDNEPELWSSTHRDVRPQLLGYDETRDRTYLYAPAVKASDPGAKTLGPVGWGWTAYFYSDLDRSPGGAWWNNPPDRNAHGGTPFVEWYLQQMRAYEQTTGTRILDYLDLHFYPQASGVALSGAGSAATQALRLRSTRALWDPAYTDESWIAEPVYLIPRMRNWVQQNYPGTLTALSEYNWGALDHINGALTQADVLGIFGREGLDLAALWDRRHQPIPEHSHSASSATTMAPAAPLATPAYRHPALTSPNSQSMLLSKPAAPLSRWSSLTRLRVIWPAPSRWPTSVQPTRPGSISTAPPTCQPSCVSQTSL